MKDQPDASLSFLDVLACALGGSSLLFLILTILPHTGANAPKAAKALTASTVQVTPAPIGAPAPAAPKLFRIEHPHGCKLTFDSKDEKHAEIGRLMAQTAPQRPEYWLRIGPDGEVGEVEKKNIKLRFDNCPRGDTFVIRAVRYPFKLKPIVLEIPGSSGQLNYASSSQRKWKIR
ncbi:MAG: hypothetical protein AB2559_15695 [Candidatus Thiodiazotropha endolucinida]